MKIGLTIAERVHVLNLLPKEGSFVTLQLIREMTRKVGFTATEITDFELKEENGSITWNDKGNVEVIFHFVDAEAEIIRKELRKKNEEGSLNMGIYSVYEKFMC